MIHLRTPRSKDGLVGRGAVDMRKRQWGELRAVSQGFAGHWWFECPKGHRALRNANQIRTDDKRGKPARCKECNP